MRRLALLLVLTLVTTQTFARSARVMGTVVDEYGTVVHGITVEAKPLGGFDLVLPKTITDESGRFVLEVPLSRSARKEKWLVYACDARIGYYPEPVADFYESDGSRPAQEVEFSSTSSRHG
jgi:hypothetical protein